MNVPFVSIFIFLCCLLGRDEAKTAEEWKSRIIYQLLTDRFAHTDNDPSSRCSDLRGWCGGTFKGIQRRLDYIEQLGANAIWISPIILNTDGGYHGYWAKDIYKIADHFGTEQDLKDLIDECHRRDIWVMVDVVANHMGNQPGGIYDFSGFFPFNHPEHYHSYCQINFSNPDQRQIEICRLANLPDLNQTLPYVRSTLLNWISNLTSNYGIDGYRVDTVRHVAKDFWPEFQKSAGVFMTGEVAVLDDTGYVADYQNYMDSLLNFPTFWALKRVFNYRNSMTVLANSLNDQRSLFKDVSVLGLFSENHDQPRFLSITTDLSLYRNLIVYNILGEGIPIIYYGLEQKFVGGGDPNNRESLWPYGNPNYIFYQYIKTLTSFRKQQGYFLNQAVRVMQVTDQAFVFTRGTQHAMIGCLTNHGSGSEFDIYLNNGQLDGIKDGTEYKDIFSSATYTVSNCQMKIVLNNSYPGVLQKTKDGQGNPCNTAKHIKKISAA